MLPEKNGRVVREITEFPHARGVRGKSLMEPEELSPEAIYARVAEISSGIFVQRRDAKLHTPANGSGVFRRNAYTYSKE
jgi:hypothetical protein